MLRRVPHNELFYTLRSRDLNCLMTKMSTAFLRHWCPSNSSFDNRNSAVQPTNQPALETTDLKQESPVYLSAPFSPPCLLLSILSSVPSALPCKRTRHVLALRGRRRRAHSESRGSQKLRQKHEASGREATAAGTRQAGWRGLENTHPNTVCELLFGKHKNTFDFRNTNYKK